MLTAHVWRFRQMQDASMDGDADGDDEQNQLGAEAAGSDDETGASQSTESLQESDLQEPEEEEEQQQEQREDRVARPPTKPAVPKQQLETKFMELPPVLEIDEEVRNNINASLFLSISLCF